MEGQEQLLLLGPAASADRHQAASAPTVAASFGVNSAHPFENLTALSNWLEMVALLTIPAALVCTLGCATREGIPGHGRAILSAMTLLFVLGARPLRLSGVATRIRRSPSSPPRQATGKARESRFGPVLSSIWEVATTSASNGAGQRMHDSFTPAGGMVGMINMLLGKSSSAVGAGIYGMMLFVLLTVFLCGLMVGRTPTYLGKRPGSPR